MEDSLSDLGASHLDNGAPGEDSDTDSFVDAMEELGLQAEKPLDFTDFQHSKAADRINLLESSNQSASRTETCTGSTADNVDTTTDASQVHEPSDESSSESESEEEDKEQSMEDLIRSATEGESVLPPGECGPPVVPPGECDSDEKEHDGDIEARREQESLMSEEEKQIQKDEAQNKKMEGNERFKGDNYQGAIECYTDALMICPLCFAKERSIMYSNRAASKYKLERNDSAIEDCTKALELNPVYLKALLRRAEIYEKTDKLEDALTDYTKSLEMDPSLHQSRHQCQTIPGRIEERNEKMKQEMLGKLKDLGNMVLRPFGLSTNNFQMQQDPTSGSYSMQFKQSEPEQPNGK